MKTLKNISEKSLHIIRETLHLVCLVAESALRGMLYVDRRIIKRYFNLETPLYKIWWERHCEYMQVKLNRERMKHEMGMYNRKAMPV